VAGYLVSYAVFVESGPFRKRVATVAPYLAVTVVWRALYSLAGYGAVGSGLYLDPVREPVHFLRAFLERGPILALGQFFFPPAEMYAAYSHALGRGVLVFAVLFVAAFSVAVAPLLRENKFARFWTAGFLFALVPASSIYPQNRQLLLGSIGAMALLAQFGHRHFVERRGESLARWLRLPTLVGALVLFFHVFLSPLMLPFTTCSVAATKKFHRALETSSADMAGRDVVFVTAPDYFAVKLVQINRRIEEKPLPRRWRALSFGPENVTVHRTDAKTLVLDYEGGILGNPLLEFYRDRRLRMSRGDTVELEGLKITVLDVTPDGRPRRAEFAFDTPLDAPKFEFLYWVNGGYSRFALPDVGKSELLPGSPLELG
jgi:hypothetical protein